MVGTYRDKLIHLTDMIHALPAHPAPLCDHVWIDEAIWNKFLIQVAELGLDDE